MKCECHHAVSDHEKDGRHARCTQCDCVRMLDTVSAFTIAFAAVHGATK